jgi:hypothetical protein
MAASTAASADCRNGTPEQFAAQKSKTLAAPSAETTEEEGYLKVRIPQPDGGQIISYFTLPGHPAHPSNVISAIYTSGGKVWLYSRGFTAGDCPAFEHWMQGFADQHEKIRQELQAKIGGK